MSKAIADRVIRNFDAERDLLIQNGVEVPSGMPVEDYHSLMDKINRLPKDIEEILLAGGGIEKALINYLTPRRTGKVFTTRKYKYSTSTSPVGEKRNANAGMFCEPSTNTYAGRDDYQVEGLFQHWDCNWVLDENGNIKITALAGMPEFKRTGKVDVGVVTMSGWWGTTETDTYIDYHYSDSPNEALGLTPRRESINPDGTISPWMVHRKYGAGDIDGMPYSSAGLILANGGQASGKPISYTGMIPYMKQKGAHYCGTTDADLSYMELMMIIKYGVTHSQSIMAGCASYYYQYAASVPETNVSRIVIPTARANNLFVGGYVSIGDKGENESLDRNYAHMHNKAYDVKVTKIEEIDATNSAVYVDAESFDTTATTYISSMPWHTGSTDSVLGSDGSPYSNTNGKNVCKIQGMEYGYGAYEVMGNVAMDIVAGQDGSPRRDVYICTNAEDLTFNIATIRGTYRKAGVQIPYTNATWQYISECHMDETGFMIPTETEAGSATGFADGLYTDTGISGQREWLACGSLYYGTDSGLWFLQADISLGDTRWSLASGVSPNGTRGTWNGEY